MAKTDDVVPQGAADGIYDAVYDAVYNASLRRSEPELWDALCDTTPWYAIPDVSSDDSLGRPVLEGHL